MIALNPLVTPPYSALPAVLVLLLVLAVVAREVRLHTGTDPQYPTTWWLTCAVRVLTPLVAVLLIARLLLLG